MEFVSCCLEGRRGAQVGLADPPRYDLLLGPLVTGLPQATAALPGGTLVGVVVIPPLLVIHTDPVGTG